MNGIEQAFIAFLLTIVFLIISLETEDAVKKNFFMVLMVLFLLITLSALACVVFPNWNLCR